MSLFDALKNLGNLPDLMRRAREMQGQMQQLQEEMAKQMFHADAGGGMVEATVNGKLELVKLRISKDRVNPADTELLEDVIVSAVHAAQVRAMDSIREQMSKRAAEMGLPPGMLPG